jgi:hypothetical protein
MFATAIDRADHRRKGHASLLGYLLKAVPELVSSRLTLVLWPSMTIERFKTRDMASSPRMSQR